MTSRPHDADRHAAIPYIAIKDASHAFEFYQRAFGAEKELHLVGPDGTVMHGEFSIEGAKIMFSEEFPQYGAVSPKSLGGTACTIAIYVRDVDSFAARAADAGVEIMKPVTDEFYGDRSFKCRCPYGHIWNFATPNERLSNEEITRRFTEMFAGE